MRIAASFLCDAANVRENLANVLSAGVTKLGRDQFPAPMQMVLFHMIELADEELRTARKITVEVRSRGSIEGNPLARIDGRLEGQAGASEPGLPTFFPLVIGLQQVALPTAGDYEVHVQFEGVETRVLMFRAELLSPPSPPT